MGVSLFAGEPKGVPVVGIGDILGQNVRQLSSFRQLFTRPSLSHPRRELLGSGEPLFTRYSLGTGR